VSFPRSLFPIDADLIGSAKLTHVDISAFIIASLVSFRSLFTSRESKKREARVQNYIRGQASHNTIGSSGKSQGPYRSGARSNRKTTNVDASLLETALDWDGPEPDLERGHSAQAHDYVPLVGITKTVDILQRESYIAREAGVISRASQAALEAFCFHESAKAHGVAAGEVEGVGIAVASKDEVVGTKETPRPEPVYIHAA